ncbi:MAG: hypothetical protein WB116_11875 [Candidatus Dormiibacterota bacterium]
MPRIPGDRATVEVAGEVLAAAASQGHRVEVDAESVGLAFSIPPFV